MLRSVMLISNALGNKLYISRFWRGKIVEGRRVVSTDYPARVE